MTRVLFLFYVTCALVFASCTGRKPAQVPPPQPKDTEQESPSTPQTELPTSEVTPITTTDIDRAMKLLVKGEINDIKEALRILERVAETQMPLSDELKYALVDAHVRYVQKLTIMRDTPPELRNTVLYSHAARILQLDPTHVEAQQVMNSVKEYFQKNNKPLPTKIEPLIFLDEEMAKRGETNPS